MLRAPASVLKIERKEFRDEDHEDHRPCLPSPNQRIASGIQAIPGMGKQGADHRIYVFAYRADCGRRAAQAGIAKAAAMAKPETARTKLDAKCS